MALFSARITELEGQLATLTTERDALTASNQELTAANADPATRHTANTETIATLTQERDTARTDLAAVTAARDTAAQTLEAERASRETAISAEVVNRLAAAGAEPIARDVGAIDATGELKADSGRTGMAKARAYFAERQPKTPAA